MRGGRDERKGEGKSSGRGRDERKGEGKSRVRGRGESQGDVPGAAGGPPPPGRPSLGVEGGVANRK